MKQQAMIFFAVLFFPLILFASPTKITSFLVETKVKKVSLSPQEKLFCFCHTIPKQIGGNSFCLAKNILSKAVVRAPQILPPGNWEVACVFKKGNKKYQDPTPVSVEVQRKQKDKVIRLEREKTWWWGLENPYFVIPKAWQGKSKVHAPKEVRTNHFPSISFSKSGVFKVTVEAPTKQRFSFVFRVRLSPPQITLFSNYASHVYGKEVVLNGKVEKEGRLQYLLFGTKITAVGKDGSFHQRFLCNRKLMFLPVVAVDESGLRSEQLFVLTCHRKTVSLGGNSASSFLSIPESLLDQPSKKGHSHSIARLLERTLLEVDWHKVLPSPIAKGKAKFWTGSVRFKVMLAKKLGLERCKVHIRIFPNQFMLVLTFEQLAIPLELEFGVLYQKPVLRAKKLFVSMKLRMTEQKKLSVERFFIDTSKLNIENLSGGLQWVRGWLQNTLRRELQHQLEKLVEDKLPALFQKYFQRSIYQFTPPSAVTKQSGYRGDVILSFLRLAKKRLTLGLRFGLHKKRKVQLRANKEQRKKHVSSRRKDTIPKFLFTSTPEVHVALHEGLLQRFLFLLWKGGWIEESWKKLVSQQSNNKKLLSSFPWLATLHPKVTIKANAAPSLLWNENTGVFQVGLGGLEMEFRFTSPFDDKPKFIRIVTSFKTKLGTKIDINKKRKIRVKLQSFYVSLKQTNLPFTSSAGMVLLLRELLRFLIPTWSQQLNEVVIPTTLDMTPFLKKHWKQAPKLFVHLGKVEPKKGHLLLSFRLKGKKTK